MSATVELEISEGIATITVSNPEVKNALDPELARQLVDVCAHVDETPEVGAAIIRGANGTFCSGADRRNWHPGADQAEDQTYKDGSAIYESFFRFGHMAVPTVAAVRGAAVGAGVNLALAADLRVVAEDAKLVAGFMRIGLHPGGGFFSLANRAGGRETAAALGLFGQSMDGVQAGKVGLAWQVVPDKAVEDVARKVVQFAAQDPELTRATVASFRNELGPPEIPWAVALGFERPSQMWSLRRREGY
jgi:enoyl-CoA hydratase